MSNLKRLVHGYLVRIWKCRINYHLCTMDENEKYPNCELLASKSDEHRHIMEFLDNIEPTLAVWHHDDGVDNMFPVGNKEKIVLEYLGVDPKELENERRAILESIRQ